MTYGVSQSQAKPASLLRLLASRDFLGVFMPLKMRVHDREPIGAALMQGPGIAKWLV